MQAEPAGIAFPGRAWERGVEESASHRVRPRQPGPPGPCEPCRGLAVVERAGLGRLRGRAGEHRPNHPDDGGVAGMMAVRRIRAERSPNRAAHLRQEHNTLLARMPPDTMRTGLARAAARGIQACGQAVAHFFGTDHARRRGTRRQGPLPVARWASPLTLVACSANRRTCCPT